MWTDPDYNPARQLDRQIGDQNRCLRVHARDKKESRADDCRSLVYRELSIWFPESLAKVSPPVLGESG